MHKRGHLLGIRNTCFLFLSVMLIAGLALSGCAEKNTPEGVVKEFIKAWEEGDWKTYKACIAPEKRNLSKIEEELARQKFEQIKVKFEGMKFKVVHSDEHKNKAVVHLMDGKIKYTAVIMGEKKTEVQDISKMPKNARPFFDTVRVKGKWYVYTDL